MKEKFLNASEKELEKWVKNDTIAKETKNEFYIIVRQPGKPWERAKRNHKVIAEREIAGRMYGLAQV